MRFESSEITRVKQNLYEWLELNAQNENIFVFDSCEVKDHAGLGKYEMIIGLGISASLVFDFQDRINWQKVREFKKPGKWIFTLVGYDAKNSIEPLKSTNPDSLQWPEMTLVQPQTLIILKTDGTLTTEGPTVSLSIEELSIRPNKKIEPLSFLASDKELKVSCSMTREEYVSKVQGIREEIANGNVYEMNLCQEYRVLDITIDSPLRTFRQLIAQSPTPFASYFRMSERNLICASPERFICKRSNSVFSQPIKGTSRRSEVKEEDELSRLALEKSEKERAEHVMIVDLVRNDLSRICQAGSVSVSDLLGIYSFRHVHQMISTISGELNKDADWIDVLTNTFPMGSMTGAPKHIAMEFIDYFEESRRGWYSGTVGYIDPEDDFDFNVIIRSLQYDSNKRLATFSVGGAITYDSDPEMEYLECQLKSKAIRTVLRISDERIENE